MEADFKQLAHEFGATRSTLRVPETDARLRMGVLVSQVDHCLNELLHRWEGGELNVDLTCVIRRVRHSMQWRVTSCLEVPARPHGAPCGAGRSLAWGAVRGGRHCT